MIKKIFLSVAMVLAATSCFARDEAQKLELKIVLVTDRIVYGKELPNMAQGESPTSVTPATATPN